MCGIFAYNGKKNAVPFLVRGLRNLEYRGYDSAGIFGVSKDKKTIYERAVGKVSNLSTKVDKNETKDEIYETGISHTRWATHGGVTEDNCHPHYSQNKRFYIVHNGIIENYRELKKHLQEKGFMFYSQTDTEVIANLIQDTYDGNLQTTLEKVLAMMVGAYAVAVIDIENPNELIGVKLGSPLIVGEGDQEVFISSDVNALASVAHSYTILEDYEMVVIKNGEYQVFNTGKEVEKKKEKINSKELVSDIGNYSCYTEKEIYDIPEVIENVFQGRINFTTKEIHNETITELLEHDIERVEIIASGTSYYAGYIGNYYLRELGNIPTNVTNSSEFLAGTFIPDKKALYIFLSQSGETADVRESVRIVKEKGCLTFGIVNVVGSTIARMCDMGLYSHAGVEVGVASTKNCIAQIGVLLILALAFGKKGNLQHAESRAIIEELSQLSVATKKILENSEKIRDTAKIYTQYKNIFFLGRNLLFPAAGEASLKCKELSYVHTESYSTGELKHGPLALVGPDFLCVVFNPDSDFLHKNISNIKEIQARNGVILGIVTEGKSDPELYNHVIEIPKTTFLLSTFTSLTAMYLFSLYFAQELGREIDKPRNLAKSVTVE